MVNFTCGVCGVTCIIGNFSDHIRGRRHKNNIKRFTPKQLEHLGQLQYLLDQYVKDYPILGLEYVVEKQDNYSYIYSCTLCDSNKTYDSQLMLIHVADKFHTTRYLIKHHGEMTGVSDRMPFRMVQLMAQIIHNKYGRKEISVQQTADDLAMEALPQSAVKQKESSTLYYCRFCKNKYDSAFSLCKHMLGQNHESELDSLLPRHLKEVDRLNYFLCNELKDFPVLGLEYIVERKVGSSCDFSCQLCDVVTTLKQIILHILHEDHMGSYIRNHHSDLVIEYPELNQIHLSRRAMYDISEMIILRYGRKKIQVKKGTINGPSMAESFPESDCKTRKAFEDEESATLPSNYDSGDSSHSESSSLPCSERGLDESHDSYSYEMMVEKSEIDDSPSAKRGRPNPEGDQDALPSGCHVSKCRSAQDESHDKELDNTTPAQELEFTTNDQFYDYLANFVIKNNEDADFIQKIIENCMRAFMSFQEEEKKSNSGPDSSLVHTSRTDQETLDSSVNETETCLSSPESTLPKDASNHFTDSLQKNNITDFFNNIKHMDESEVVDLFQKIATTNPEFKGMNIPTVIRYLRNSGRLKNA